MPTTIFTLPLNSDAANWEDNTFRIQCSLTGGAQDRVRVRFEAAASGDNFHVDNASIGIWTGSDSDTTTVPVELLFNGNHGFLIGPSNVITSDWVALTGFTASDYLIVIFDVSSDGGDFGAETLTGVVARSHAAADSYNSATTPAGSSGWGDTVFAVNLIETQSDFDVSSVNITNIRRSVRMVGY